MSKGGLSSEENNRRLSSFGKRLQSLSDSFYSTILEDAKDKKIEVKTAQQLQNLHENQYEDFTFDQCSTSGLTSNDDFSFTFHSNDQTKTQIFEKYQVKYHSKINKIQTIHLFSCLEKRNKSFINSTINSSGKFCYKKTTR